MQHWVQNGSIGALILNSLINAKFKMPMLNKWKIIRPCIPCISIITTYLLQWASGLFLNLLKFLGAKLF